MHTTTNTDFLQKPFPVLKSRFFVLSDGQPVAASALQQRDRVGYPRERIPVATKIILKKTRLKKAVCKTRLKVKGGSLKVKG